MHLEYNKIVRFFRHRLKNNEVIGDQLEKNIKLYTVT